MESFEEKQLISLLLDIYGELLTDRQKSFIQLHYNEDLSYGEIAETENISRQAVHDTIQHGKKALFNFDEKLKLSEHNQSKNSPVEFQEKPVDIPINELDVIVKELCSIVQDDIMYDTDRLKAKVHQLRDLIKDFGNK
jgi:predicted DNA-binding protein YlxM (UPF0122 family)